MLAACGYKEKKDLEAAVGKQFGFTETSVFGNEFEANGKNTVVGPSAYEHRWFATVVCQDGKIVSVK